MIRYFILAATLLLSISGCGEDTSEPPSEIAERLAKAKAEAKKNAAEPTIKQAGNAKAEGEQNPRSLLSSITKTEPGASENKTPDRGEDDATSPFEPKQSPDAVVNDDASPFEPKRRPIAAQNDVVAKSTKAGASDGETESGSKPSMLQAITKPKTSMPSDSDSKPAPNNPPSEASKTFRNPSAAAKVEGEAVTAGGKTVAEVEKSKEENKSVVGSTMSLLDKLRVKDDKKAPKGRRQNNDNNVQQVLTRTGRFAIRAETWLRLQSQLAKRFYVSATGDGAKIAASSGQRSLGVLSTQVEVVGEKQVFTRTTNNVLAQTRTEKEVITQPVRNLPAILSCIELLDGGNTVAIGTFDGRILARSGANVQDWDLYGQDLYAFQDERRSSSRIGKEAVVALRAIGSDRMFTIMESGKCAAWKTDELVHPAKPILEIDEKSAIDPEIVVTEPSPIFELKLPQSTILNVSFSKSGKLAAVVLSNETITLINTESGQSVDQLDASHFDDTQPVSLIIEEERKRVVVGLADGRIFRRAFADGTPVKGSDDKGNEVDYETVFAPDVGDTSGPITAMELKHDNRILYLGRLDGTLTLFDLPRKQPFKSQKLHNAPIIEIRSTFSGVFTIADDRVAKLSDRIPGSGAKAESFNLPKDASLKEKVVVDDGKETKTDKFTRARHFNREVTSSKDDSLIALGIRPADPVLALLEHQLRVTEDPKHRDRLRTEIRKIVKPLESGPNEKNLVPGEEVRPPLFAELLTNLDYEARPFRRPIIAVSDDGKTAAVAQYYAQGRFRGSKPNQPVFVWDTLTGTRLRAWRRNPGILDLDMKMQTGVILPTPMNAQLRLYTGQFKVDENAKRYLTWVHRPNGAGIAVGLRGVPGIAQDMVQLLRPDGSVERQSVEGFEGAVTALAFSADGNSLFVNLRERTKIRLLELEASTLKIVHQMAEEPVAGAWDASDVELDRGVLGATKILPSPEGKLLVTYGRYEDAYHLRVWRKSSDKWPLDNVNIIRSKEEMFESPAVTDTPIQYVENAEKQMVIIGKSGVGVMNLKDGVITGGVPFPALDDRRPLSMITPDGRFVMAGDRDGKIWIWEVRKLDRAPRVFKAHPGPIAGLAMSSNAAFLATTGEENRLRIWDSRYIESLQPLAQRSK